MQHCNLQINIELMEDLLGSSHGGINSDPKDSGPHIHSSASTHVTCLLKVII